MAGTSPKKTLSLCMIVKNEEKLIESCINSVKDYVDEIIIVDTGSTDRTVEIAALISPKVKTYAFEWVDDFSSARNFSLTKATCDWILVIDADEILAIDDIKRIKQMIQSTALSGFQLIQRTYTNKSDQSMWCISSPNDPYTKGFLGYVDIPITRLFKNLPLFRFTGRVHEDITPSMREQKQPLIKSDIIIHHYEYSRGNDFVKDKQLYYLELTLKKIKDQPDNPKAYADAGVIYYNYRRDLDKALFYFRKTLELDKNYKQAYNYVAKILSEKGDKAGAEDILRKSLSLFLDDITAFINLGVLLMDSGRLDEAISCFNKAISLDPRKPSPYYNLGLVHEKKQELNKAIDIFGKYMNLMPYDARPFIHMAKIYERLKQPRKALKFYKHLIAMNHPNADKFRKHAAVLERNLELKENSS